MGFDPSEFGSLLEQLVMSYEQLLRNEHELMARMEETNSAFQDKGDAYAPVREYIDSSEKAVKKAEEALKTHGGNLVAYLTQHPIGIDIELVREQSTIKTQDHVLSYYAIIHVSAYEQTWEGQRSALTLLSILQEISQYEPNSILAYKQIAQIANGSGNLTTLSQENVQDQDITYEANLIVIEQSEDKVFINSETTTGGRDPLKTYEDAVHCIQGLKRSLERHGITLNYEYSFPAPE